MVQLRTRLFLSRNGGLLSCALHGFLHGAWVLWGRGYRVRVGAAYFVIEGDDVLHALSYLWLS